MSGNALGFFHDSDRVRWYRGMSAVQTEACDGLLHALRDDMEQGSTFRVRRCVFRLGLHPLVDSSQIKDIMAMSQGNDLAFLWFLWHLAYKSPQKCRQDSEDSDLDSEYYSVNEQLLLSGIAHLDMPTTLRALDALLPPPTQSKKRNCERKTVTQKSSLGLPQGPRQRYNILPYFAPQVRPREFIPQSKFQAPESRLGFPEYSQYSDRMHQIPNERSRWFAQYQFVPAKRLVTKLLSEELGRLALEPKKDMSQESDPQCETHRFLEKAVDTRREEKVHSDLQRCLSRLDVTKASLKARRKRILQDIEKNVECLTNKVGGQSFLNQVKCSRKEGGSCGLCKHTTSPTRQTTVKRGDVTMLMGLEENPKIHLLAPSQDNLVQVMLMQKNESQRCGAGDCEILKVDCALKEQKDMKISPKRKRSRTSHIRKRKPRTSIKSNVGEAPHLPTTDFKNLADLIPACSRTLRCLQRSAIRCPEEDTFTNRTIDGFQLDFHRIYDLPAPPDQRLPWKDDVLDLEDKQPVIEKLCIEALRSKEFKSLKELKRKKSLPSVLKAAANCAIDMFRKNVAEVGENQPDKVKGPNQLIDPDNKLQIESLLKAALQVLRTNPHFVLATFSNAHKMPVLLDWVADRYGKTFSKEDMQALVRSSYRIFDRVFQEERLNQREMFRLKKSLSGFGGGSIRYDSYRKFMCLVGQRKTEYNNRLNDLALEQSRLTWLALRGYSHLGGQIKDTFFAYMPARHQDLKRQHIWKSDDYRDMVKLRLRTRPCT